MSEDSWGEEHDVKAFLADVFGSSQDGGKHERCSSSPPPTAYKERKRTRVAEEPRTKAFNAKVMTEIDKFMEGIKNDDPKRASSLQRMRMCKVAMKQFGLLGGNFDRSRADHTKEHEDLSNGLFVESATNNRSRGHAPMSTQTQDALCAFDGYELEGADPEHTPLGKKIFCAD